MDIKLILSLEETLVQRAKNYAKSQKKSLSDLIENYLQTITKDSKEIEIGPVVKSLKGAFSDIEAVDYKQELSSQLSKKYLRND